MGRNIRLFISVFLFFIGNSVEANSDVKKIINRNYVPINDSSTKPLLDTTKHSAVKFIEKEFNYYAPLSGTVNLMWSVENFSKEEAVSWNKNTKLAYGSFYLPMDAYGDTFRIKLRVPTGTSVQYYFWISKNKEGLYQDFIDLQSSDKITFTDDSPITKNAKYSKATKRNNSQILSKAWLILVLLIFFYLSLQWLQNKWIPKIKEPERIEKILYLGISLLIFHALARSEIININLWNILNDSSIIPSILRAGINDFLFIIGVIPFFAVSLYCIKNDKIRKIVYILFLTFAIFSTLVAFTNITTVLFFGKPFTYQWLYYSEFLNSNEARTAIKANMSKSILINLIAISLAMWMLAGILRRTVLLMVMKKQVKYVTYFVFGLGFGGLVVQAYRIDETWTKGQSENAITSMVYSMFSANSHSSFFTAKLPDSMEPFDPAKSIKTKTQLSSLKDNKVKNVIFIILESAGACYFDDYTGTYQLSPNLSKYANRSLMFKQMYAHDPITDRSLVSILASMYPNLSYKSLSLTAPEFNFPTLSSVLKNNGYRTSFFTSADISFHNGKQFLDHSGFDCVEDFSVIDCGHEFQLGHSEYKEGNGIDDMCLADRLTSWLDENDSAKNFFSMIWTVQGHYPYFFSQEERDFGVTEYNMNRYLNCLQHDDDFIGNVIQALTDRGLDSTTLLVVTGDHGEAFGQHGLYGHGSAIYEEFIQVPLYFINPTLFHGEQKNDVAGMKDLASTALSVLGIDIPPKWQGRDLLNTDSNEAFYFATLSDCLFGYRKDHMKFIFNESNNTVEVYDLKSDPAEKNNLYSRDRKEEIDYARNQVAAWTQFQNKFMEEIMKKTD